MCFRGMNDQAGRCVTGDSADEMWAKAEGKKHTHNCTFHHTRNFHLFLARFIRVDRQWMIQWIC